MFRISSDYLSGSEELYKYLSQIASPIIRNALNVWAGNTDAVIDLYRNHFAEGFDEDLKWIPCFFAGISEYISPRLVRTEFWSKECVALLNNERSTIDDLVGLELLARKIQRMIDKMADPDAYYTFDLFEEYLFALMLEDYTPFLYEGFEDPYIMTTERYIQDTYSVLVNTFGIAEQYETEEDDEVEGNDFAEWLARSVHRVDQMSNGAAEDAGYDSIFFWDDDYSMAFGDTGSFIGGIRWLVSGYGGLLGYEYSDITDIFTDIGIDPPLHIVGTETYFETSTEVTIERARLVAEKQAEELFRNEEETDDETGEEGK